MNIYDKIFTYVSTKEKFEELNPAIIEKYKNSLIFIGDQKQIYQPLTQTYIGIGEDKYRELLNQINQSNNNLDNFNTYIHNDVVTGIFAQYNENELETIRTGAQAIFSLDGKTITQLNKPYLSKTNRNVLVKGIYDYNPEEHFSNSYYDVNVVSNNNNARVQYDKNLSYGSSGINIKLTHGGSWQHSNPTKEFPYGFSYWSGQDTLTIDDTLTWSYIGYNNKEIKEYARNIAAKEANRIYKNLLGEDVEYISKDLDNILYYDSITDTITQNKVYIKEVDNSSTTGTKYVPVYVDGPVDGVYTLYKGQIVNDQVQPIVDPTHNNRPATPLAQYNPSNGAIELVKYNNNGEIITATLSNNDLNLSINDGYIPGENSSDISSIIWYTEDPQNTAAYNYNLKDGINTIKEVAHVLDMITDGDDTGITLAYNIKENHTNIQELLNWKNTELAPESSYFVTSFESNSDYANNFIVLNSFSDSQAGKENKGDIKLNGGLILAYTYTLNINNQNITYAAYCNGQVSGNQYTRYFSYLNYDSTDNYINLTELSKSDREILKNKLLAAGELGSQKHYLYQYQNGKYETFGDTIEVNALDESTTITTGSGHAFLFYPYKEYTQDVSQGITTVNWVTTYVGHGLNDLSRILDQNNTGAQNYTDQEIGKLNASYTAPAGKYISKIIQTAGKLTEVSYTDIPQDKIFANQLISSYDNFIKITYKRAQEINTAHGDLYINTDGVYNKLTANSVVNANIQYYIKETIDTNKFILVNDSTNNYENALPELKSRLTDSEPANDPTLKDLVGLDYNFFIKVPEYYNPGSGDPIFIRDTYVPLDIQTKIKEIIDSAGGSTPDLSLDSNPVYYLNESSSSNRFDKYIDASTNINATDGHTDIHISTYISYLSTSNENNTGLADAYDVRKTIERMFTWVDLSTESDFVRNAS